MKTSKKISLLATLVVLLINVGCSGTPMKIDSVAKQPFNTTEGRVITSDACGFQLLLFIPIMINSRHERAYNALLAKAQGDYVTNVKVQEKWIYGFVGTGYCTELEANAFPYTGEE